MKKIIFISLFLVSAFIGYAQIDTLFLGDRDPVYYYWDTNWWDYKALKPNSDLDGDWLVGGLGLNGCNVEYARFCYVDTSLRVIGIAAAVDLLVRKSDSAVLFTNNNYFYDKMLPEYFRLYEVDSLGDSMHFVTEGQWTVKQQPKHYIQTALHPKIEHQAFQREFETIYEVYFDSVVTVYDSFYVSLTGNNQYRPNDFDEDFGSPTNGYAYIIGQRTYYEDPGVTSVAPNPNHYKRKLRMLDNTHYDLYHGVTDTLWHTFNTYFFDSTSTPSSVNWHSYMYIFPIIDTANELVCQLSHNLTVAHQNEGTVTLAWDGGYNAQQWELSMCNDSCAPDDGTITQWSSRLATVTGLEKGTWYTAWVRSVCDSVHISDWCDSIKFYIPDPEDPEDPDDPDDPEGIETTADRYSYLMPNPASGSVTVASSFRIAEVELFSLDGRSLLRSKVDAMSTALNLDGLAAGTYIVRIATTAGTAYKKLVVK